MIRSEDGTPVGSIDVSALSDDEKAEIGVPTEAEQVEAEGNEDLSSLLKADLVARAEAAGVDTTGMTKADLVEALESEVPS